MQQRCRTKAHTEAQASGLPAICQLPAGERLFYMRACAFVACCDAAPSLSTTKLGGFAFLVRNPRGRCGKTRVCSADPLIPTGSSAFLLPPFPPCPPLALSQLAQGLFGAKTGTPLAKENKTATGPLFSCGSNPLAALASPEAPGAIPRDQLGGCRALPRKEEKVYRPPWHLTPYFHKTFDIAFWADEDSDIILRWISAELHPLIIDNTG